MSALFSVPAHKTVRVTPHWRITKDGDPFGIELYEQHCSCYHYADKRERRLFIGPGEKLVLIAESALFAWRNFIDDCIPKQTGVNCAVFINKSPMLSSSLIIEAERVAWCRWPDENRLYTTVKPSAVKSVIPGWCFICAGWKFCGETQSGLLIFEKLFGWPNSRCRDWKAGNSYV